MSNICFKDNLPFIYNNMDSIKEDIHTELRRLRIDKTHLYTTLLKIIDAIPQAEAPVEPVAELPVVEKVEAPQVPETETPPPTPVKKTAGRKKKVTEEA
jgi:hypothetical protein